MIKIGEKIKFLRKQKNISQEVFANYLGISFQAVSKWENGNTLPDVTMIPAIASFFKVSTDELFDFNLYEVEKNVKLIVDEHSKYWDSDINKAEQVIREGLKKYPGNETLLNCLLGVLSELNKNDEVITLGKALIETSKEDEVRIDTYRILAETYKKIGEYQLAKDCIECIPELYFTKLEIAAKFLEGKDSYEAARKQRNISAIDLIDMLIIIGKYYQENNDAENAISQFKIAQKVVDAFVYDLREYKIYHSMIYKYMCQKQLELEELLGKVK